MSEGGDRSTPRCVPHGDRGFIHGRRRHSDVRVSAPRAAESAIADSACFWCSRAHSRRIIQLRKEARRMQARRFVQSARTGLTLMAAAGLVASGLARAGDRGAPGVPASTTMTLQERPEPLDDPSGRAVCGIPRTGQTSCWNENSEYPIYCAGTGQDGENRVGVWVDPRDRKSTRLNSSHSSPSRMPSSA